MFLGYTKWLSEDVGNTFLASIILLELGFVQGKGMKHRLFHFTSYEVCREDDSLI
jgi:hypothetical protein